MYGNKKRRPALLSAAGRRFCVWGIGPRALLWYTGPEGHGKTSENPAAGRGNREAVVCLSRKVTGEIRKPRGRAGRAGDCCLPLPEGPREDKRKPRGRDRGAGRLIQKRDTVRDSALTGREPSGKRLPGRRSAPGKRRWRPHRQRSRSAAGPWRRWQRTARRRWRPAAAGGQPCRRR